MRVDASGHQGGGEPRICQPAMMTRGELPRSTGKVTAMASYHCGWGYVSRQQLAHGLVEAADKRVRFGVVASHRAPLSTHRRRTLRPPNRRSRSRIALAHCD